MTVPDTPYTGIRRYHFRWTVWEWLMHQEGGMRDILQSCVEKLKKREKILDNDEKFVYIILRTLLEKYPSWPKGLPWKGSRSLIAARGFKSLLLRQIAVLVNRIFLCFDLKKL